jgi:predicted transcriptional regulator
MPKASANLTSVPSVSPFHNLTTGAIVDRLGALKAQLADLKGDEEALRGELIARKVEAAEGDLFRATVTEALRQSLDTDQVKAEMGERWYASHCKIGIATTVRVSARTGSRKAA